MWIQLPSDKCLLAGNGFYEPGRAEEPRDLHLLLLSGPLSRCAWKGKGLAHKHGSQRFLASLLEAEGLQGGEAVLMYVRQGHHDIEKTQQIRELRGSYITSPSTGIVNLQRSRVALTAPPRFLFPAPGRIGTMPVCDRKCSSWLTHFVPVTQGCHMSTGSSPSLTTQRRPFSSKVLGALPDMDQA